MYAESFGDEGREATEEEAIPDAGQARNEGKIVRVLDGEGEYLGDKEDECGDR
jgi:hypothetical protein